MRRLLVGAMLACLMPAAGALAGERQGPGVIGSTPPAVREAVRKQRAADIAAQLAALRAVRVPEAEQLEAVRARLRTIAERKGVNQSGWLLRVNDDLKAMLEGWTGGSAYDALVSLDEMLAGRGIDLIVVPVPSHVQVLGFRIASELSPGDEPWPEYRALVCRLLEHHVEVLDLSVPFRASAASGSEPADLLYRFDHHWTPAGRQLGARLLAERLRRYPAATACLESRSRLVVEQREVRTPSSLVTLNGLDEATIAGLHVPEHLNEKVVAFEQGSVLPCPDAWMVVYGDSMVAQGTSYPRGSGFPNWLSAELGCQVANVARNGLGGGAALRISRDLGRWGQGPQVVVLVVRAAALLGRWEQPVSPGPQRLAPPDRPAGRLLSALARAEAVSPVPDPATAPYPDALTVTRLEILGGPLRGRTIIGIHWVLRDRRLVGDAAVTAGRIYRLRLTPWSMAVADDPALEQVMLIDALHDLEHDEYWIQELHEVEPDEEPRAPRRPAARPRRPGPEAERPTADAPTGGTGPVDPS